MKVSIDKNSGYCFGVEYAIQMAEDGLAEGQGLYCLGDIVHNSKEVERLHAKGLKIVEREHLAELKNTRVLIRAHGEPPSTYKVAMENNLELIDASCPVVLKLQNRVKAAHDLMEAADGQVVIYGKQGHAEVIGLTGQTMDKAIIVTTEADLDHLDYSRPIVLFSQTTKSTAGFYAIKQAIEKRLAEAGTAQLKEVDFKANDSICRQVSNREPQLREFSNTVDVVVFVAGKKSSNGKALFGVCQEQNPRSYFVEDVEEINPQWFEPEDHIGICGATSTPMWLMEKVADHLESLSLSEEAQPV